MQIRSLSVRPSLVSSTARHRALTRLMLLVAVTTLVGTSPLPADSANRAPGQTGTSASKARNRASAASTPLDPSARMLSGDDASEHWTLYVELENGVRIAQRFLLTNTGPGDHNAVALGHLVAPGHEPFEYVNGRRRSRWTLSEDRLFLDIAASHLDLHRPTGELRITKDDIEIRLFFDLGESGISARVPSDRLPKGYAVDVLAVGAPTRGTIRAPWMSQPVESRGHTWLVHTTAKTEESLLIDRRVEIYGRDRESPFYGLQLLSRDNFDRSWALFGAKSESVIESVINVTATETSGRDDARGRKGDPYPVPTAFRYAEGRYSGLIYLGPEWLRFDPLSVIPQPIQWFVRRNTNPEQVWADARIGVRISIAPDTPSLPDPGEAESDFNSNRETESETAERSVTGVASITFLNPTDRR